VSSGVRITMTSLRNVRPKLCASGIRAWCASKGVDYTKLLFEGIPIEEVAGLDDHYAISAIEEAVATQEGSRGEV